MLEIPGEEAPTDPGAAMRAKLQAEQRKVSERARRRRIALLAVAGCLSVVAAVGGLKWWDLRQAELTYDLPDEYYQPTPLELQIGADVPTAQASSKQTNGAATVAKVPTSRKDLLGPDVVAGGATSRPDTPGAGDASPAKVAVRTGSTDAAAPTIGIASGGSLESLTVNVQGGIGNILTEDEEILAMVKDVVGKYKPQLDSCFRMRLNAAPDLRGSWTVSFTVTPLGASSKVAVQAVDKVDREFESCVTRSVSTWRFLKIEHPFNVRKKYTFVGAE